MSKIKNGGLDQYGAERFGRLILLYIQKNAGLKGLNLTKIDNDLDINPFTADPVKALHFAILV